MYFKKMTGTWKTRFATVLQHIWIYMSRQCNCVSHITLVSLMEQCCNFSVSFTVPCCNSRYHILVHSCISLYFYGAVLQLHVSFTIPSIDLWGKYNEPKFWANQSFSVHCIARYIVRLHVVILGIFYGEKLHLLVLYFYGAVLKLPVCFIVQCCNSMYLLRFHIAPYILYDSMLVVILGIFYGA